MLGAETLPSWPLCRVRKRVDVDLRAKWFGVGAGDGGFLGVGDVPVELPVPGGVV